MADVKIGFDQLNKPTPKYLKNIFKIILFVSAVWAFMAPQITEISPLIIASINKWLLIGNGIIRLAISFFGLDYQADYSDKR